MSVDEYHAAIKPLSLYQRERRTKHREQREGVFQATILEAAKLYGWARYHTYDSRHSVAGYPDLELVRYDPYPRLIKAELKDTGRRPTVEQIEWLNLYAQVGAPVEVYLWYPTHLDRIVDEILKPEFDSEHCEKHADPSLFGLWTLDTQRLKMRAVRAKARGAT